MKRRDFITLLGGAAAAWPFMARVQQAGKLPTIGFLGSATPSAQTLLLGALLRRLRDLGWIEGRTVAVEVRWSEGRPERAAEITAELARLKVDVIVTSGAATIIAAKRAAPATPIVFAVTSDPVGTGLVESLARPGGTITGLSAQSTEISGKQIELLREIIPGLRRLGVVASAVSPGALAEMGAFAATASNLGYDISTFKLRGGEDIGPVFKALEGRVDAISVVPDPVVISNRIRIITLALAARIPAIYSTREYPEVGGLMSYGPNLPDLYRRAAEFVDKILRGTKPADIPVEQPNKFDLIINLTTAKALGLTVSEAFLLRADEVIE